MSIRRLSSVLSAAVMVMIAASCQGKVDPEFISGETSGLKVKESVIHEYDPLAWQYSFNREKCEFRAHTDNMSDYYCLTLNCVPTSEGQKAKGSITWTSRSDVITRKGLTFSVERVDRSGHLWLWCKKERIGAVVQILD